MIISGGPELGGGSLSERVSVFRERFDYFRSALCNEPRGSEAAVGALLCTPVDSTCATGVIFFNNVGYLGMCGHGTIGLAVTLAHLRRIKPGTHRVETPAGVVATTLHDGNTVTVENVPSFRKTANVELNVDKYGTVRGDVAYGGNWFFLAYDSPVQITPRNLEALTMFASKIREELERRGITGDNEQQIDHIELFGPPTIPGAQSKNFVLCPGKSYDRSPCGTGTSAKLACLVADGQLREGEIWRQESLIGSVFEGSVRIDGNAVYPSIKGSAFVTAESTVILDPADPFRYGIR